MSDIYMFLHAFLSSAIENQSVVWPETQKEGLLTFFVANIDLLVCLLTLGDWQAGGSD